MLTKMKKVSLVGERTALKQVLDTLKANGNFQISFYKNGNTPLSAEDAANKTHYAAELNRVTGVLNYIHANDKPIMLTYSALKNVTKQHKQIETLLTQLEKAKIAATDQQTRINLNSTTIENLQPYRDLPIPANLLQSTKTTFVLAGLISSHNFTRFTNDIDTKDFLYETYPTAHQNLLVVIILNAPPKRKLNT